MDDPNVDDWGDCEIDVPEPSDANDVDDWGSEPSNVQLSDSDDWGDARMDVGPYRRVMQRSMRNLREMILSCSQIQWTMIGVR